jgi:NAD(P)H-hydrate epimerase
MQGAPRLAASAALRAGAGYVLLASTGGAAPPSARQDPVEAVSVALVGDGTLGKEQLARCAAVVIGPGLSLDEETRELLRQLLSGLGVATVYDAGALQPDFLAATTGGSDSERPLPVLTPHDGEFARIVGRPAGPDRIADVRQAAVDLNAVVLLKGPTTVIAHPDGRALLSTAGDERLATAGTGDVLAGTIAAGLAGGLDPFLAAGLGAELHGRAAQLGAARGLVAGDLPPLIVEVLSGDRAPDRQPAATRMD